MIHFAGHDIDPGIDLAFDPHPRALPFRTEPAERRLGRELPAQLRQRPARCDALGITDAAYDQRPRSGHPGPFTAARPGLGRERRRGPGRIAGGPELCSAPALRQLPGQRRRDPEAVRLMRGADRIAIPRGRSRGSPSGGLGRLADGALDRTPAALRRRLPAPAGDQSLEPEPEALRPLDLRLPTLRGCRR